MSRSHVSRRAVGTAKAGARAAPVLSARERVVRAQAALARQDRAAALLALRGLPSAADDDAAVGDWGVLLVQAGELGRALPLFEEAHRRAPHEPRHAGHLLLAWKTEAEAAFNAEDYGRAAEAYARCEALAPAEASYASNHALALLRRGRTLEAVAASERAVATNRAYLAGWSHLGLALLTAGRLDEAATAFTQALALAGPHERAEVLLNAALVEDRRGGLERAVSLLQEALALDPLLAEGWNNLGLVRREQGEIAQSLAAYDRALALRPGWAAAVSGRLLASQSVAEDAASLGRLHRALVATVPPAASRPAPRLRDARPDRRLTIAYVSPDFREHPVGRLMTPVLEARDRQGAKVIAYVDLAKPDGWSERLAAAVDVFVPITGLPAQAFAERVAADGVDVLIDLAGHTGQGRWAEMRPRLAPVQVSYLGYPGDLGVDAFDARLSDEIADPGDGGDPDGTPIVHVPGGFLAFGALAAASNPAELPGVDDDPPLRREGGPFTFGSFNNAAKLSDATVRLWAAVLRAVPGSRLLLKARGLGDEGTRARLVARFEREGVEGARLDLRGYAPSPEGHLATYRELDVALDPTPYAGTTTTCEALWMGVPVVTLRGRTHAARVGASLLHHAGLDGWIADDLEGYVARVRLLAEDAAGRAAWRRDSRRTLRASPLGDARRLARALEQAFRTLWRARVAAATTSRR